MRVVVLLQIRVVVLDPVIWNQSESGLESTKVWIGCKVWMVFWIPLAFSGSDPIKVNFYTINTISTSITLIMRNLNTMIKILIIMIKMLLRNSR